MQDIRQLIGERVQILRNRKKFSQDELAGLIDIDPKSVSRLERGVHYPSLETLEKMRVALGVELKDFFDFEGRPSAEELRDFLLRSANQADYPTLMKMVEVVQHALKDEA